MFCLDDLRGQLDIHGMNPDGLFALSKLIQAR